MLHEMATGVRPFQGRTGLELSSAILHKPPAQLPETVPLGLRTAIGRCLEKEPERRYQRAGEVHAVLEAIQTGATPPRAAQRPPLDRRGWRTLARPWLFLTVVAASAAALGVGWWAVNKPASPVHRIESLVVLPFEDLSEAPAQEYVLSGMHQGVISGLTRIAALRVIAPLSAAKYAGSDESASTIAKRLGVDAIVKATMRTAGDRVQLHVQLIRGSPEQVLWGHTYDAAMADLLNLQSQLARGIAAATQVTVTPQEASRLAMVRRVTPNAQEAYLKAQFFFHKLTPEGHAQAFRYLQEALAADSTWSAPYALLAQWYVLSTYAGSPPIETLPKAKEAVATALEGDSSLAEAHMALGLIKSIYDWDWTGAEQAFRQALTLKPGLALGHTQYAMHLSVMRRHDEAVGEAKLGVELDPLSNLARGQLSMVLNQAGRHQEAIDQASEAVAIDPTFGVGYGRLMTALIDAGRTKEAMTVFERRKQVGGSGWASNPSGGARIYALSGRREEARRALNETLHRASERYVAPGAIAQIYVALGETDEAMRWLQRAYDSRDINLPGHLALRTMEPMRTDPRFQALVRRMNLPHLAKADQPGR
jgi:TolB-like protein/Tfp pilus assembly protein PilF